ncbi:GIY-YIG nuclease family protein [Salinisphaera orenii]|uniref:GIY-YIG nuclease family protein n=1 Tax=Salinisphaera orenii TaxID=856731 RepID=UPI000DBE939C
MSQGRSIRLFLVDGAPTGLLTAEIVNWTGHVLTGPRSKLSQLVQRPECGRTGIYFLVGPDPDHSFLPRVYIGETDDVSQRLKKHNRPEEQGGKDFWERVCLVTSKDQNLTKAHVKYLESLLIRNAGEVGRCTLVNGTAHDYTNLPESDKADMSYFRDQIRTVLPVLGFDFLRPTARTAAPVEQSQTDQSPIFVLSIPKHAIKAKAREINGEFVVLEGSVARNEWVGPTGGYQALFHQLCNDGVLATGDNGLRVFTSDQEFSSPSAAAAIISGRSANGRIAWSVESTGQTYSAWQDQQVSAAQTAVDTSGYVEPEAGQ